MPKPGHQCGMLPEIHGQRDPADIVMGCAERPDHLNRTVGRTVINQNDLILIPTKLRHRPADLFHHMGQRQFGPVTGESQNLFYP